MARRYNQHCALAHALDLIGERWTLLIVRELLAGPRRYTDLSAGLVSVPTNLLSERLKQMEANGLVQRAQLPSPAVAVYELTELGLELAEPMAGLARWGMRTLPPAREDRQFQSHWLVVALTARFRPEAAAGVDESYEFRIEGDDVLHFAVTDGEGRAGVGPADDPAVVVSADADTFLALSAGAITSAQATGRGAKVEGSRAAVSRMGAILPPIDRAEAA